MEPISTTIITYVALKFVDQFLKEEGYGRIKTWLFPKKRYQQELVKIIYETINDYEKLHPFKAAGDKFPFYHSQVLFSELLTHVLFNKKEYSSSILNSFKQNPKIEVPTEDELMEFFSLFVSKVNRETKLKELYIDENYKSEIFEISGELKKARQVIEKVERDTTAIVKEISEISRKINPAEHPSTVTGYINRKEEGELIDTLESNSILLLSGISFCGKSQVAKKIAQVFINKGYRYYNRTDIGEAERILRNTSEPILLLLEDPFGHNSESQNEGNWRKVQELIRNLPSTNKIIITSRIEVLRSINCTSSLEECLIEGNHWIDLTNNDVSFLQRTWEELCNRKEVPEEVRKIMSNYLLTLTEASSIQVGQLNHLANIPKEKLRNRTLESLLHFSKADSKDISQEIKKRGTKSIDLFLGLGLGATTNISISFDEIAFILSDSTQEPGFFKELKKFKTYSYGRKVKPLEEVFPKYMPKNNITAEILEEIGFLQSRGFIYVENELVWFTHPTYYEAARYLLIDGQINQVEALKRISRKVISCLSPKTAINSAKQIRFIYENTRNNELLLFLQSLASNAVRLSIFPGVRDNCFTFLLGIIDQISSSNKSMLLQRLEGKLSEYDIRWNNDIPFIDPEYSSLFDDFNRSSSDTFFKKNIDLLNSGKKIPTSAVWDIILHLRQPQSAFPNPTGIRQILSSDEVFIRQGIAFLTLKRSFPPEANIIDTIFSDNHPAVVFEGMKGAIQGFPNYSNEQREQIKPYLIRAICNELVVVRANNLFSTFGIDYGSESIQWEVFNEENKRVIWDLWAELFPLFLNNYPSRLRFSDSGRFGATLRESIKYLSAEQSFAICEAYYEWLEKYILKEGLPDTHEFSILPHLLESTEANREIRFVLFQRIFSHTDTNFVTYSLSWCISYWNKVTEEEKKIILKLLSSNRVDQRWLWAVSLTQHSVPPEIQELILCSPNKLNEDIDKIVTSLPSQLLSDCLSVFCGHPQPLWWLGLHGAGRELWSKVIIWILKNEYPVGFDISLREIINDGVNGFGNEWKDDAYEVWEHLCNNSRNKRRLAERLIIETSRCSCVIDSTQKLWHILIDSYEEEEVHELVQMIIENIEALQSHHPEDILDFFDRGFLTTAILPLLELDALVIDFIIKVEKGEYSKETIGSNVEDIMEASKDQTLRLDVTFDMIKRAIKNRGHEFPEIERLLEIPNNVYRLGQLSVKKMDEHYELENWTNVFQSNEQYSDNDEIDEFDDIEL